jgi:hypothetical protein
MSRLRGLEEPLLSHVRISDNEVHLEPRATVSWLGAVVFYVGLQYLLNNERAFRVLMSFVE